MTEQTSYQDLSDEKLVHDVIQAERDMVTLQFQNSMSTLENTARLGVVRKQIARLKTEARAREIDQGLPKDALFDRYRKTFAKVGEVAPHEVVTSGGFLSGIVDKLTGKE